MNERERHPTPNSYWVIQDCLAAGEYPGAKNVTEAAIKVRTLLRAGISHFIDLTEPEELEPYSEIAKVEARHLGRIVGYERYSIIDQSVPCYPQQMSRILDAIDLAMTERQDRVRPLLGRSWTDRYCDWLLVGPIWAFGQ